MDERSMREGVLMQDTRQPALQGSHRVWRRTGRCVTISHRKMETPLSLGALVLPMLLFTWPLSASSTSEPLLIQIAAQVAFVVLMPTPSCPRNGWELRSGRVTMGGALGASARAHACDRQRCALQGPLSPQQVQRSAVQGCR